MNSLVWSQPWQRPGILFQIVLLVLLAAAAFVWYRRFLGTGRLAATLILLFAVLVGASIVTRGFFPPELGTTLAYAWPWRAPAFGLSAGPLPSQGALWVIALPVWSRWLFLLFLIPFVVKLYLKWAKDDLTEAERAPGAKGIRAWLGGGNLFCAFMIALCGWMGFGYSFVSLLILALLALLLYPLIALASQPVEAAPPPVDNLANERERILKMLDEGKINAEESADLLNALGTTVPRPRERSGELSASRKLILIGAALVVVGFSLPWFTIYRGHSIPWFLEMVGANSFATFESNGVQGQVVSIGMGGGGLSYGLGWLVLLLALGAALMPWFGREFSPDAQRRYTFRAAIASGVILCVLIFPNLQSASIGVLLVALGIALEFVGAMGERKTV